MGIGVVTGWTEDWEELGNLSWDSKGSYCERNGYAPIWGWLESEGRHPAWGKIRLLEAHLADYDWLWWSDADLIVVNPQVRLEGFIEEAGSGAQFLIADDGAGLNAGSFLIRNTVEMARFLEAVWGWGTLNPGEVDKSPWEQRAIQQIFFAGKIPGVRVVSQRWFNAYDPGLYDHERGGCYREGDLALHYPGGTLEWKIEQVRARLARGHAPESTVVNTLRWIKKHQ